MIYDNILSDYPTENESINERHPLVKGVILNQYCTITGKRREIGCIVVFFINRKSHKGLRLVPTSVTFE